MVTKYIFDSDFSSVPDARGIYSWFYPIIIYEEDTYDSFIHRIRYFLNFSLFTNESKKVMVFKQEDAWDRFELVFQLEGKTSNEIKRNWNTIKHDEEFKRCVLESSFWNRPLYVGKAQNLFSRIDQHQSGQSGFSKTFQKACENYNFNGNKEYRFASSLSIKHLMLSYTILNFTESRIETLEKILQQTTKPNFSKR
jgi:hypothetical protein